MVDKTSYSIPSVIDKNVTWKYGSYFEFVCRFDDMNLAYANTQYI